MSIPRILALAGICLLLAGCAPATGFKSIALLVSLLAACGAAWGISHKNNTDRVCRKAQDLDDAVTAHVKTYHKTSATVVKLTPTNKGNGVAEPDTVSHLSQGM